MTDSLLAIDVGTSGIRASLRSPNGDLKAVETRPFSRSVPVVDAPELWDGVVSVLQALPKDLGAIKGIGTAALLGSVLVDAQAAPLTSLLPWSDDSAGEEARWLCTATKDPIDTVIGRPMTGELAAAKLRWLWRHQPHLLKAARWLLSIKDYLVLKMTGVAVTDPVHASYTGLFDVRKGTYSDSLVQLASGRRDLLPPVKSGLSQAGGLLREVAELTGLPTGLPVAVGGPDGSMGAIGAGAVRPGLMVDVAGTTDVLLATVDAPPPEAGTKAVLNRHVIDGLWTVGGPTGMTGGALEWLTHLLGFASVSAALDALEWNDSSGSLRSSAMFFPSLGGSRFPNWEHRDRAALVELGIADNSESVLRAAVLGTAFSVREGIDAVSRLGVAIEDVVIVGGVASRPEMLQLRSDAWQLPIRTVLDQEATSVGAAIAASLAAGVFPDVGDAVDHLVHSGAQFLPSAKSIRIADRYSQWQRTSGALRNRTRCAERTG